MLLGDPYGIPVPDRDVAAVGALVVCEVEQESENMTTRSLAIAAIMVSLPSLALAQTVVIGPSPYDGGYAQPYYAGQAYAQQPYNEEAYAQQPYYAGQAYAQPYYAGQVYAQPYYAGQAYASPYRGYYNYAPTYRGYVPGYRYGWQRW